MACSLLLLASLLVAPANAAPRTVLHAVGGESVVIGDRTLVIPWRLDSPTDLATLRSAAALSRELGVTVVALNVDAANEQARIVPWLRSHGCFVPSLADPDGSMQRRLGAAPGEILVFAEGGGVVGHLLARTSTEGIRAQVANVLGVPNELLALAD
jgi:hypothetical protein